MQKYFQNLSCPFIPFLYLFEFHTITPRSPLRPTHFLVLSPSSIPKRHQPHHLLPPILIHPLRIPIDPPIHRIPRRSSIHLIQQLRPQTCTQQQLPRWIRGLAEALIRYFCREHKHILVLPQPKLINLPTLKVVKLIIRVPCCSVYFISGIRRLLENCSLQLKLLQLRAAIEESGKGHHARFPPMTPWRQTWS